MHGLSVADWTSIATAVGTLALAAVTAISLRYGRRALNQTQDEIALSRVEVEEAHRPVLVPDTASVKFYSGNPMQPKGSAPTAPLAGHTDGVYLVLHNIGSGPALNVLARAQLRGDDGNYSIGGGRRWWERRVTGIGAGDGEEVWIPVDKLADLPCLMLELRYTDVAAKPWVTRGLYMNQRSTGTVASFTDLVVKRAETSQAPVPTAKPRAGWRGWLPRSDVGDQEANDADDQ